MGTAAKLATEMPLSLDDGGAIEALGDVLRSAGYTGDEVQKALGVEGEVLSRSIDIPLHERRLEDVEPLASIVKLFVLDLPVPTGVAARAFAPLSVDHLERLGVVAPDGDEVRPLVRIVPHDEILIASDRRLAPGSPAQADHVAGVHQPSVTLALLTVRRPVASALDVGTGCGIQAILAARHSERVLATDLNERALRFAAFNARLNRVENVEFRAGSFFEPAAGSRFDLVTSNPPYVISPESEYLFRDSGLPGDSVSREVVRQTPAFLEEGGFATVLVSWIHSPGEDWSDPLREWVEGSGCDAWLIHYKTEDPLTHAANWNRDQFAHDADAFAAALDRWLEYFERLGAEGIAYGAVVLRRRSAARNWVRADEQPSGLVGPASDQILRVFAAQDYLSKLADDRALLGERFVLAPHDLLEQRVVLRDGAWIVDAITLSLEEGLGFRADTDQHTVRLLASLDGRHTLAELLDGLTASAGADAAGKRELVAGVLPIFRTMLGAGFLELREPARAASNAASQNV